MDIETKNFIKHGSLKTKTSMRSILWTVNFSDICNDLKRVRSDLFMVSTLPNCIFYLSIAAADTKVFTVYVNRCVSSSTSKTSAYVANIAISFEDMFQNWHSTTKSTMSKDVTCVSSSYDQNTVRNNILVGNNLQIHCTVTLEESNVVLTRMEELKDRGHRSSFSTEELKDHIRILLDGDQSNKVVITVNGEDYPVHKTLLCSISPVFSAMFTHDTVEKQHSHVIIADIHKDVIGEILKYIYTGDTSALTLSMNIELYIAADKYAISNLKERCSRILTHSLNQDSVLDLLVLSHQYSDANLKNSAVKFLIEKGSSLLEGDDFLLFIKNESEIIQSILLTLIKQVAK